MYVVEPDVFGDDRGYFVETYRREWFPRGREMVQGNRGDRVAGLPRRPPLPPAPGRLLVRAVGTRRVVLHDLRVGSPTDGATQVIDLGAAADGVHDHRGVFIPPGVAHGFAALTDMTITYLVDSYYNPADELGVAWNDPDVEADWGVADPVLSKRDQTNPARVDIPRRRAPALRPEALTKPCSSSSPAAPASSARTTCTVLEHTDDTVTVFDALTYAGNLDNLADLEDDPRFTFVKGDICDREAVLAALDGHDVVVHFAAESHVDRSIVSPDEFVRTNCVGTNVLCDVARGSRRRAVPAHLHRRGVRLDRRGLVPRDRPAPAALAVLRVEGRVGPDRAVVPRDLRAPGLITRSSNNFGPYQFPEKVIPLFVTNLLDGQKVPLYGDGLNVRDWCYVEDNCAGIDLVLREGDRSARSTTSAPATRSRTAISPTPSSRCSDAARTMIEYVEDRLGHDRRYSDRHRQGACARLVAERELDEALGRTVAWYRDNAGGGSRSKPPAADDGPIVRVLITGAGGQLGHDWSTRVRRRMTSIAAVAADARRHRPCRRARRDHDARARRRRPRGRVHRRRRVRDRVDRAFAVNALGHAPRRRRRRAGRRPRRATSRPITCSTARRGPYDEWDIPNPQSVYGRSKLRRRAGARSDGRHHDRAHRPGCAECTAHNIVKTILRLAAEHDHAAVRRRPARSSDCRGRLGRRDRPARAPTAVPDCSTRPTRARCRGSSSHGRVHAVGGTRPGRVEPVATADLRPAAAGASSGELGARQRRAAPDRRPAAPALPRVARPRGGSADSLTDLDRPRRRSGERALRKMRPVPTDAHRGVLSVVMPCFNEEATVREIVEAVSASPLVGEMIVVDDASTDGDAEDPCAARRRAARASSPSRSTRARAQPAARLRGRHGAVRDRAGRRSRVRPGEYDVMLGPLLDGKADVVYGSRFQGGRRPARAVLLAHASATAC